VKASLAGGPFHGVWYEWDIDTPPARIERPEGEHGLILYNLAGPIAGEPDHYVYEFDEQSSEVFSRMITRQAGSDPLVQEPLGE
jgi:hypothetical protein